MANAGAHRTSFLHRELLRKTAGELCARPCLWTGIGVLQFLLVMMFSDSTLFASVPCCKGELPSNLLLLGPALVVLLFLGIRSRSGAVIPPEWGRVAPALLIAGGSVVCAVGAAGWSEENALQSALLMLAGSIPFSLGTTFSTIEVCAVLGRLGARTAILYGAAGTLVNLVLITLFHMSPVLVQAFLFVTMSAALPTVVGRAGRGFSRSALYSTEAEKHRRIPWRLTITSFFQGLSFGFIYYSFPLEQASVSMFAFDMLGFLLAAACLFVAVGILSINYNRLIYQVCFILISLGYALLALLGPTFEISLVLKNAGYTILDIAIISLSAYLVRERKASVSLVSVWPSFSLFTGHLVGACLTFFAWKSGIDAGNIYAPLVFVLMGAALLLSSSENMKTGWGMAKAGDETLSRTKLSLACGVVASDFGLTTRESEVLALLAGGKNKASIAERLTISVDTAKTHIANIYRKTGVHSQQELIDIVEVAEKGLE